VLGVILIMCGCICLKAHWYDEGYKKGSEFKEEIKQAPGKLKDYL
jgi:hypothetical protein